MFSALTTASLCYDRYLLTVLLVRESKIINCCRTYLNPLTLGMTSKRRSARPNLVAFTRSRPKASTLYGLGFKGFKS